MEKRKKQSHKDEDAEEDIKNVDEVWIKSVQDINAGDEITVDYGSDKTHFFPKCLCKECSRNENMGQSLSEPCNSDNTKKEKNRGNVLEIVDNTCITIYLSVL